LAAPPGNRLEALRGDTKGQHSIRINDQWCLCFGWLEGNAYDGEIADRHWEQLWRRLKNFFLPSLLARFCTWIHGTPGPEHESSGARSASSGHADCRNCARAPRRYARHSVEACPDASLPAQGFGGIFNPLMISRWARQALARDRTRISPIASGCRECFIRKCPRATRPWDSRHDAGAMLHARIIGFRVASEPSLPTGSA
jgi:hypothetical protein